MGLARLMISFLELMETEVRALGMGVLDLKIASILAWVAGFLFLLGFSLTVSAVFFFAREGMSTPAALLMTGILTLAVSGGILWGARKLIRRV